MSHFYYGFFGAASELVVPLGGRTGVVVIGGFFVPVSFFVVSTFVFSTSGFFVVPVVF